ncbi:MAG: bifunctional 3-(3-hydroxy-phenyl)propionate/3-hydroxycinnamic acid hydroxylase [Sandaracinaceae bacterium]|nr:bifunctional 3-(3-hydroxy-phenyl)propionate/3-hydroxycinnamic acid hydroxylase [Sandaracinaceae bacterium]
MSAPDLARGPTHDVDVLVVGYGPVGAALAGLLGVYGVRTLVVDKAPDLFMAPRAIALDNEALRILQSVGLADTAFAKVAIPFVKMHSPRLGQFAQIETAGTIDGHPKLVTFYQPELERALRAHAERHACVTARVGLEMIALAQDDDGVDVTLRSASGESRVRARYVVGADGASSRTRALLGLDFEGETYPEDWLIVDATGVPDNIDHVEFLCDPDRPTPHMVAPGGRTRWEFMLRAGETREEMESDAKVAELLAPWLRGGAARIERKAVYRFHARACRAFGEGRVFLAGDAAHVTPPFVGQGLVAGLRDAVNLAWKLAWVVSGQAASAILESYDRERRPHASKMIALAKRMGTLVMPQSHARAFLVHAAMALARRAPAGRRFFDELGIKPPNAYPDGLFVEGGSRGLRGTWFPQGLLDVGTIVRSDDLLGPSLALVGLGRDPHPHLSEATLARWSRAGGRVVHVGARGAACPAEDLEGRLVPGLAPHGSCVVVRPDRTILHDGSVERAEQLVDEALALLRRERGGGPIARAKGRGQYSPSSATRAG